MVECLQFHSNRLRWWQPSNSNKERYPVDKWPYLRDTFAPRTTRFTKTTLLHAIHAAARIL